MAFVSVDSIEATDRRVVVDRLTSQGIAIVKIRENAGRIEMICKEGVAEVHVSVFKEWKEENLLMTCGEFHYYSRMRSVHKLCKKIFNQLVNN
jgi:hypothetical protein